MARIATTALLLVLTLLQAGAQSRAEQKKIEAMQLEAAIKNLVYSGSYRFYANSATPVSSHFGKAMGLDPYSYGMTITPEKIESYLPFYGTSSSIQYGSTDSPLTYTSTHFTYEIADPSTYKQKMIRVIIEAHPDKNQSNTVKNVLDIYFNGTAELWVDYLGQSGMKFRGVVNEDKPRK